MIKKVQIMIRETEIEGETFAAFRAKDEECTEALPYVYGTIPTAFMSEDISTRQPVLTRPVPLRDLCVDRFSLGGAIERRRHKLIERRKNDEKRRS